jgi:protein MBA1
MSERLMGLTETFIPPITKLSSLFKTPKKLLRLQWAKLKFRFINYGTLMVIKFSSPQAGKRWYNKAYKINRRQVLPKAMSLHTEIYAAFAEGDARKLRELCADGMYESFRARIATRQKGEVLKWELLKYNKKPKVVSDRAVMVPGMAGMAVRQAVVRIASQQRLTRLVGGRVVKGSGEKKDLCEYVVVQSNVDKWEGKGWKVWGTTKETTLQDIERWKKA